uniref:Uncharacterized protein n=1 Tax=Hucho hucho TaxID=62062 RepID=A0A4W5M397_9TELE
MDNVQNGVQIGDKKFISKATVLSHLKTYNLYYDGQNLQLRHREVSVVRVCWCKSNKIVLVTCAEYNTCRPYSEMLTNKPLTNNAVLRKYFFF